MPNYEYEDPIKLIESKNTLFKMAQSHVNTYLIGRKKQQSFDADLTHKGSIFLTRWMSQCKILSEFKKVIHFEIFNIQDQCFDAIENHEHV